MLVTFGALHFFVGITRDNLLYFIPISIAIGVSRVVFIENEHLIRFNKVVYRVPRYEVVTVVNART